MNTFFALILFFFVWIFCIKIFVSMDLGSIFAARIKSGLVHKKVDEFVRVLNRVKTCFKIYFKKIKIYLAI